MERDQEEGIENPRVGGSIPSLGTDDRACFPLNLSGGEQAGEGLRGPQDAEAAPTGTTAFGRPRRAKRPDGEGSIARRPDGRFWARLRVEGKRVSLGIVATYEEAEAKIAEAKARIAAGEAVLAEMLARKSRRFIYVAIEDVPGGAMKIGTARNPAHRLLALQTGTPRPLRLLCVMPGGHALERALHAAFEAARLNGEWFRPTPALMALVAEMRGER